MIGILFNAISSSGMSISVSGLASIYADDASKSVLL